MTTATAEKKTSKKAQKALDVQDAKKQLLAHYVSEGSTVYTVLRSVSSSGMSRTLSLKVAKDGKILDLTYYAGIVLDWPIVEVNGSRALRVGGCGMDMGFHTVYTLFRPVFYSVKRARKMHCDAGYALNHAWA
jgi:hypothetical protein